MKKITSLLLILSMLCTVFLMTSCGKKDETVYTISVNPDNSPFTINSDDGYEGIDLDLINSIFSQAGLQYTIIYKGDEGKADFYMTEQTTDFDKSYSYTDSYFNNGVVMAVKDTSGLLSYEELLNTKIGIVKNSPGHIFANDIAGQLCFTLKEYKSASSMYKAVENGDIDGCIGSYTDIASNIKNSKNYLKIIGDVEVLEEYAVYTKDKDKDEVIKKINEALKEIENNGIYENIIKNYLSTPVTK